MIEAALSVIGIVIVYIIVIRLVKKAVENDNTDHNIPHLTDNKPLAFTYVKPQAVAPKVEKKKGGFVSKELLRSYLSYKINKDK